MTGVIIGKCALCVWSKPTTELERHYCCFYPPVPSTIHALSDGTSLTTSQWPIVSSDSYCSKFFQDLSK